MTYEEKFEQISKHEQFKALVEELREKWLLGLKTHRTVFDIPKVFIFSWKDMHTHYPPRYVSWLENNGCKAFKVRGGKIKKANHNDWLEFWNDIRSMVTKFKLPYRCDEMVYDYVLNGKIKKNYPKIRIEYILDGELDKSRELLLYVSPDARLVDMKRAWRDISHWQKSMHQGDIKTQKIRKPELVALITQNKKVSKSDVAEEIFGRDIFYRMEGGHGSGEFHEATKKARRVKNSISSRYKKKIKPHIGNAS